MDPRPPEALVDAPAILEIPESLAEEFAKAKSLFARVLNARDTYRASVDRERLSIFRDTALNPLWIKLSGIYIAAQELPDGEEKRAFLAETSRVITAFRSLAWSENEKEIEERVGVLSSIAGYFESNVRSEAAPTNEVVAEPMVVAETPTETIDYSDVSKPQSWGHLEEPVVREDVADQESIQPVAISVLPSTLTASSPSEKSVVAEQSNPFQPGYQNTATEVPEDTAPTPQVIPSVDINPMAAVHEPLHQTEEQVFAPPKVPASPERLVPDEFEVTREEAEHIAKLSSALSELDQAFKTFGAAYAAVEAKYPPPGALPEEIRAQLNTLYDMLLTACEHAARASDDLYHARSESGIMLSDALEPADLALAQLKKSGIEDKTPAGVLAYGEKLAEILAKYRSVLGKKITLTNPTIPASAERRAPGDAAAAEALANVSDSTPAASPIEKPSAFGVNPALAGLNRTPVARAEKPKPTAEQLLAAVSEAVHEGENDLTRRNLELGTKALKNINKAIAWYKGWPRWAKWSVTAGIIGVGVGASLGAGMPLVPAIMAVLTKRAFNVVVGTAAGFATSKAIEKAIDMSVEAASKKWQPWFDKYPEATKFFRELRGVVGVAGGMAVGMWAAGNTPSVEQIATFVSNHAGSIPSIIPDRTFGGVDSRFDGATSGATDSSEASTTATAAADAHKSVDTAAARADTSPAEAVTKSPEVAAGSPLSPETVVKGDTVWGMIREDMETRPELKDAFAQLTPDEQNAAIDRIENKLQALSGSEIKDMGIVSGDLDQIRVGESVDLDKAIDVSDLQSAIEGKDVAAAPTAPAGPEAAAQQPVALAETPLVARAETATPSAATPDETARAEATASAAAAEALATTPPSEGWNAAQTQQVMGSLVNHFIEQPQSGWVAGLFGSGADDASAVSWIYGGGGEPAGINGSTIANIMSAKPEGPYAPQAITAVNSFLETITKGTDIDLKQPNWQDATVEEVAQAALSKAMAAKAPWFTEFANSADARGVRTLLGG